MVWFGYEAFCLDLNTLDIPEMYMRRTKPGQNMIIYAREAYSRLHDETGQDKVGNKL